MAGYLHRSLLAASAHYVVNWRYNVGAGHTPPRSAGDDVPPPALRVELDDVAGRGDDDLLGDGKWSRADVHRYGGLVHAAYDAFAARTGFSRCAGGRLLPGGGLTGTGAGAYVAIAPLHCTVDIVPGEAFDDHLHWVGYVAVAAERDADGFREIAVVWRGTATWDEWFKDVQALLVPIHGGRGGGEKSVRRTTPPPPPALGAPKEHVHDELTPWRIPSTLRVALAMPTAWDVAKARVAAWFCSLPASTSDAGKEEEHGGLKVHDELIVGQAPSMLAAGEVHVADGFHSLYASSCRTCKEGQCW
ncbi:hypothetical protein ACP4OV_023057 [Aristida adscensionis]